VHSPSHHNSHHHHHHHGYGDDTSSRRIGLAFFLNASFTVIEFIGGWLTNSTAIMADAVHDLGDSLSIGSAWLLQRWGRGAPNDEFTYGYRRLSLFGAFINGVVLLLGSAWVIGQALPRLADPVMPATEGMLLLALFGVAVNGYAAYRLSQGTTLNERVLNWHLLEDVLGWVAILILSLVLLVVELPILDPLLSIGFTLFILVNVFRNLWLTGKLFFQAVPDKSLRDDVHVSLMAVDGVADVHHLHLWSLDGEHHVLTAHVVSPSPLATVEHQQLKAAIAAALEGYELAHTTIEIEQGEEPCRDGPRDCEEP